MVCGYCDFGKIFARRKIEQDEYKDVQLMKCIENSYIRVQQRETILDNFDTTYIRVSHCPMCGREL